MYMKNILLFEYMLCIRKICHSTKMYYAYEKYIIIRICINVLCLRQIYYSTNMYYVHEKYIVIRKTIKLCFTNKKSKRLSLELFHMKAYPIIFDKNQINNFSMKI